jgi:hypothetical protein
MAASQVSDHERDAWAEPDLIASSNKILDKNKSRAKIEAESGLTKVQFAGREHYLKKFKMVDRSAGFRERHFGDNEVDLVDDCGGANQQMLGGEHLHDRRFAAETNAYGDVKEYTGPSAYNPTTTLRAASCPRPSKCRARSTSAS